MEERIFKLSDAKAIHSTYRVWVGMINRCSNNHKDYAGRGIDVSASWRESFDNFISDMGLQQEGCHLDRTNNDGNYCKENCKWVTPLENQRNKRSNKKILINGNYYCYTQLAEMLGISRQTLYARMNAARKDSLYNKENAYGLLINKEGGESMLKDFIAIVKKKGILQVSIDLNYSSSAAVANWIRLKKIPKIRYEKVKQYINETKKGE